MLRRVLNRVETAVLHHPRALLGVALVLVAVSLWLGLGIELRTARADLVPEGDKAQARWESLKSEYGGLEPLILVLETETEGLAVGALEDAAERVAAALADRPAVADVFYRVDLGWLEANALRLAPPADLERGLEGVEELFAGRGEALTIGGFADLNDLLAARIERGLEQGSMLPADDAPAEAERLVELIESEIAFLEDPAGFADRFTAQPLRLLAGSRLAALTDRGYLATRDQRALFLLVAGAADGLEGRRELVSEVRAATEAVLATSPGVRHGLTGPPAMEVEEMASIGRDGRRTSIFAIAGVFVLSLLAFERRRHALLGLLTLAIGTVWALGAVRLELGYLNMITTALVPILVGMGVGYAVHILSQYELERRVHEREEAVRVTYRTTSAAVTVSALTTAAAFFCFLFMRFKGFAELGLVTGVGVVLCLVATLTVLPALLMLRGAEAKALGLRPEERAVVDRFWNRATARRVCRFPRLVVTLAAIATVVSALAATRVRIDSSLLELLPAGAESLRYLDLLHDESDLSNDLNIVVAGDLDELRRFATAAAERPSVERFESILDFLPESPEASDRALERAQSLFDRVEVGREGSTPAAWSASLARLEGALAEAADSAFVAGLGELSAALERARGAAERAVGLTATRLGSGASAVHGDAERRLLAELAGLVGRLKESAAAPAPTLDTLPSALRDRFVTERGRYLGYLHPAGEIYDPDFLARFNTDALAISEEAIGFPVLFEDHSRAITGGFEMAFAIGGGLIFVLLLIDLRHVGRTLLALAPVVLGTLWMLGLMRALGLDFNLANLVAVPIVLGVGIDGGVHVIHRFRLEGAGGLETVVAHTGRAVLIASLTTMVGFGSLALASHRGMASLGTLLLAGVATSLLATLVFLPNLLLVLGLARDPHEV